MLNDTKLQQRSGMVVTLKNRVQLLFEQNAEWLGVDCVSLGNYEVIGLA